MAVERINYQAGETACTGALVYDDHVSGPRPLLLMSPNWLGVSDDSIKRAATIACSKYVAFVADMYGGGKIPAGPPEAAPLANGLRADAPARRRRIAAALDALRRESDKRKIGDLKRQAAVGFCFGGGNVLELARAGADLQAVICLHGDLIWMTWPMLFSSLIGCSFILEEAVNPESAKDSLRYPNPCIAHRMDRSCCAQRSSGSRQ